jgi:hypothetical protein
MAILPHFAWGVNGPRPRKQRGYLAFVRELTSHAKSARVDHIRGCCTSKSLEQTRRQVTTRLAARNGAHHPAAGQGTRQWTAAVSSKKEEMAMAGNIVQEVDDWVKIERVLISVSDKAGLQTFIPRLIEINPGIHFYSTPTSWERKGQPTT